MTQKPYKCRVEYLESTGTQWLKTDYTLTANTKIDVLFSPNQQTTANLWVIGSYVASNKLTGVRITGETTIDCYINTVVSKTVSGSNVGNRYQAVLDGKWTVNGSEGTAATVSAGLSPLTLFGWNASQTANTYSISGLCSTKIYYCKIWDNGVPVRDFIPVLDNSGRPAMYDQVSGQLFYNQGSGEFTYGRQIIPVEYLESTGTQYIDTGLKGKNGYDFDYKFNSTRIDGTAYGIGGEWENGKSCYLGLIRDTNYFGYHYQNTNSAIQVQLLTANTDYRVQAHLYSGEQYYILNGTKSAVGTITGTFTSTSNMRLFSIYSATPLYSYVKMYYCKIYDNGVLVRDFIPCIDENLTPFMFDKVHNTVYLNAGTGQFKVGPNVEKVWGGKKLRRKLALALANLKKPRKYYCEVEYLESTGTQWIDTEYVMTSGHSSTFNGNIMWTQNAATANFFYGYRSVNSATYEGDMRAFFIYGARPAGRLAIRYGVNTDNSTSVAVSLNTKCNISFDGDNLKVNGTTYATLTEAYTPANYKSMWLFWCNCTGYYSADVGHFVGRIYNWQIVEDGVLVRDFIPVLDWNMKPCLFDKVTEQLFYNQATSGNDFLYGREIHPVDYLESTGTQYIDTGVKLTNNHSVELDYQLTNASQSRTGLFGALNMSGSNQGRFGSILSPSNRYLEHGYGSGNDYWQQGLPDTDRHLLYQKKNEVYFDGTLIHTFNTATFSLTMNAYLGNFVYTNYTPALAKYYRSKWWDNNTLVRDYIPAIDENGVGFMFDRVSHTIYDNVGTGAFGYSGREVEYLESDGARAIVAGVTVDDTCGYDVKWMALNANDTIILGTKGSGDSRWVLSGNNNPNVNISWNTSFGGVGLGLNKIQTAQMNYFNDRKRILNDTPLTDITQTLSANASTYNVGIFGGYWGESKISLYSTCRIYYAKISKGTGLVRDFVPMFKDGSPCLFDKIGGLYYFGTGTGSFTTGKILEPEYE